MPAQLGMSTSSSYTASQIEPDLVTRAAKGDAKAFEALYDQSSSLLFTLVLRILGDRDETAELLQEVYLEVWRKAARYDPARGSPVAWLITLARSRAIDRLRSRASRGHGRGETMERVSAAELPAGNPGPEEAAADRELRLAVTKALAELPEGQQQAMDLAFYEGLSHAEIAAKLRQPLGTIKTRIRLGMSKLKGLLGGV